MPSSREWSAYVIVVPLYNGTLRISEKEQGSCVGTDLG